MIGPKKTLVFLCFAIAGISYGEAPQQNFELSEADESVAGRAFESYWKGFDEYERAIGFKSRTELDKQWQEAREIHDKEANRILTEQMDSLQKASREYRRQLSATPNADNRPHVLLNLAMVQRAVSEFKARSGDISGASIAREDALSAISEIIQAHPGFVEAEKAMYLRALLLSADGRTEDALDAWKFLAAKGRGIHAVHAHVAIGDRAFKSDDVKAATESYRKALAVLRAIPDTDGLGKETGRIQYRIAWSAFRAGEFALVLTNTKELLGQARQSQDRSNSQKVLRDATELIASTLYEINDSVRAIKFLRDKELQNFVPAIGLSLLEKLGASGLHTATLTYGRWLTDNFPFSPEAPKILVVLAMAQKELKKTSDYISTLEKLSMLLPATSLWRSRNRGYPERIHDMELAAVGGAEVVSSYYYENGLASGSQQLFVKAAVHYQLLLDQSTNGPSSNRWRLRIGHCQYFSEHLEEAEKIYESLVTEHSVNADILEVAAYHLVLTKERIWRSALSNALAAGVSPKKAPLVLTALDGLRAKADSFANKYPSQGRSIDLLLVAAGAFRDAELFDVAKSTWQRVLIAGGAPNQRATAIRGVVLAAIRQGSAGDVAETAERFLNLEDWKALGGALAAELQGILSTSVQEHAEKLAAAGKTLEAGQLLTRIGQDFRDVPDRAKIYRDGGYQLALAGAWAEAHQAAQGFLDEDFRIYRDDMTYLKARSLEYQLKIRSAALSYLELGQKFPKYSKSSLAFERAERFGKAEDDLELCALAAEGLGNVATDPDTRLAAYTRAADYRLANDDIDGSLAIGRKRLLAAKTEEQKLRAQVFIARVGIRSRRDETSFRALQAIAKKIDLRRSDLGEDAFHSLAAESHYLLGVEAQAKFDDFDIFERKGTVVQNVSEKSKLFERLASEFSKSAAANSNRFSSEARYRLAESAEKFADEVSSIPARSGEALAQKAAIRLSDNVTRLRNMAKATHTGNVMSRNRLGGATSRDEWVQKSSRKLNLSENGDAQQNDAAPSTVQMELPFEWSL